MYMCSVAYIGHSGAKKTPEHDLNSVLPYSKSIITPISTTWHGSPFYFWWWTVATISVWGTEIPQGHANRHLAYPPQTDVDRLISIYRHLFTSTAHLICRALRSHQFDTTHWWWGRESGVWSLRPRLLAPGICACHNTTTGSTRGVFRHTQPDQGTDDTTHWGSKQTKKRGHSLSQTLIPLVSTLLCRNTTWQHNGLSIHGNTQLSRHDSTSSRRYSRWLYCQALDAFSFCKWPTAITPNKKASCERPFLHEKKYPRGGPWRHKHQTPIKHTSTEANRSKILS